MKKLSFSELLKRSSLGTKEVEKVSSTVSDETVARALKRADELSDERRAYQDYCDDLEASQPMGRGSRVHPISFEAWKAGMESRDGKPGWKAGMEKKQ